MNQNGLTGSSGSPGATEIVLLDGTRLPADFAVEVRWVTDRLAIGGMIGTAANVEALRGEGITHVLNLQDELDDRPLLAGTGITLRWLRVPDAFDPFPAPAIHEAVAFAREALAHAGARLFIHCLAGRSRSPTFAWAILRSMGWSGAEAFDAITRVEPAARLRAQHIDAVVRCLAGLDAGGRPARADEEG